MTEKVITSDLTKRVAELWTYIVNQGLASPEEVSFDAFLGAQYSVAYLAGQCTITKEGIEIVEVALDELEQLLNDSALDGEEGE